MYLTGNYLRRKQTKPTIPNSSHLDAPNVGNPFAQLSTSQGNNRELGSSQIMSIELADNNEVGQHDNIQRTSSGGFPIFRKRTTQEQRLLSYQRAAEMILQYELSENRDSSLNRHAKFGPPPMPSLGASLGLRQAAFATMPEKLFSCKKENDTVSKQEGKTGKSNLTRPPLKSQSTIFTFDNLKTQGKKRTRAQQRIEIAQATRKRLNAERASKVDMELFEQVVVNVLPISPGVYSVAPTTAETPSPRPSSEPVSNVKSRQAIHRLC